MTEADRLEFWRGFWNKETTMQKVESVEDIVEVVRCKDCKHSKYREDYDDYECEASGCGLVNSADFYCADGKRRESNG